METQFVIGLVLAIFVLYDAKKIGIRKGLVTGLGNLSAWGWFWATSILGILGFGIYWYYRGRLIEAVAASSSGPISNNAVQSLAETSVAHPPKMNPLKIVGAVLGVVVLFSLLQGSGLQGIHDKVAEDAVKQYDMASRNGSSIDACVHAGLVSAAYLQAQDETGYKKWKSIEQSDCRVAGINK